MAGVVIFFVGLALLLAAFCTDAYGTITTYLRELPYATGPKECGIERLLYSAVRNNATSYRPHPFLGVVPSHNFVVQAGIGWFILHVLFVFCHGLLLSYFPTQSVASVSPYLWLIFALITGSW